MDGGDDLLVRFLLLMNGVGGKLVQQRDEPDTIEERETTLADLSLTLAWYCHDVNGVQRRQEDNNHISSWSNR